MQSTLKFKKVETTGELEAVWELGAEKLIQKALSYSHTSGTSKRVKEDVKTRKVDLHYAVDFFGEIRICFTTDVVDKDKYLVILLAGGGDSTWKETYDYLCAEGSKLNCTYIFLNGRRGWERRIKHLGFELQSVVLSAPIKKG